MLQRPDTFSLQIPDAEFVVCDLETTGLSPDRNRITEIALVRVADGAITERWESLVNPRQFIPREITEITGISNEMVYGAPDIEDLLPQAARFIGEAVFVAHNARFDRSFLEASLRRGGAQPLPSPMLCTARLARRLAPTLGSKSLGSIARHLGIRNSHRHRAGGDADTTARVLLHFLGQLQEEFGLTELGELLTFQNKSVYRVTGAPKHVARVRPYLDQLPSEPGVYYFHDRRGAVLYVGKARCLRDRVSSYFTHNLGHTEKVQRLAAAVHSITWETEETELSALLAEARAIKQLQPRFNTLLKHDRAYPFIRIDAADPFPTAGWTYEIKDDGAEYFGPFSSRFAVEQALDSIGTLFLLRECDGPLRPKATASPCIYHGMHRCGAPCALMQNPGEYAEEASNVIRFLRGEHDAVLDALRGRMAEKAAATDFEGAAVLRDRIQAIERIVRQGRAMARSIREQRLVLVTLARGTNVELHCIREGLLARTLLVDQRRVPRAALRRMLSEVFFHEQAELFPGGREDVGEMRIIASWCLTRRDESTVVTADDYPTLPELFDAVLKAVEEAGRKEKDEG